MTSLAPILLVGLCCAVARATLPNGYILQVTPSCNALDDNGAVINIITDLSVEASALCDGSTQRFITDDNVNFRLDVGYPGLGPQACVFQKKDNAVADVFEVKVIVSFGDIGGLLHGDEEFTVTCTFELNKAEDTENQTIGERTIEPVEVITDQPGLDKPVEIVTEEAGSDQPVEMITEEAGSDQPVEIIIEEAGSDKPVEMITEEAGSDKPVEIIAEEAGSDQPVEITEEVGSDKLVEIITEEGESDSAIITLRVLDVNGDDLTEQQMGIGRRAILQATASGNAPNEKGLKISSCDAVGNGERYSIITEGCGDGIVFSNDKGFHTDGLTSTSPVFDAFRFNNGNVVNFECNFTLCSTNCDGDSCELLDPRIRRSEDEMEESQMAHATVFVVPQTTPNNRTQGKVVFVRKSNINEPTTPITTNPYFVIPVSVLGVLALTSFIIALCACARRRSNQVYEVNKARKFVGCDTPNLLRPTVVRKQVCYSPCEGPCKEKACGCPRRHLVSAACIPDCEAVACTDQQQCKDPLGSKLCDGDCVKPCDTESGERCDVTCTNDCNK